MMKEIKQWVVKRNKSGYYFALIVISNLVNHIPNNKNSGKRKSRPVDDIPNQQQQQQQQHFIKNRQLQGVYIPTRK